MRGGIAVFRDAIADKGDVVAGLDKAFGGPPVCPIK